MEFLMKILPWKMMGNSRSGNQPLRQPVKIQKMVTDSKKKKKGIVKLKLPEHFFGG